MMTWILACPLIGLLPKNSFLIVFIDSDVDRLRLVDDLHPAVVGLLPALGPDHARRLAVEPATIVATADHPLHRHAEKITF